MQQEPRGGTHLEPEAEGRWRHRVRLPGSAAFRFVCYSVTVITAVFSIACGHPTVTMPQTSLPTSVFRPLDQDLRKSYLELFKISPKLEYSQSQITAMHDYLEQAKAYCQAQFRKRSSSYGAEVVQAQDSLKEKVSSLTDEERHNLHCDVQNNRELKSQADVIADHAIPVAYQNKEAKLELISEWPDQYKEIIHEIADKEYLSRRWGDVKDIGFREIEPGQEKDIKLGKEAIEDMKKSGLMPKTMDDEAVVDYVDKVALQVAGHSDLSVPLKVTVLNTKEVNAFALPGGFLYVERGLLEKADDEAELAGVIGHEIGHVVARHGHKLMVRGTIASMFFQAAQMAAIVLTGGVAGIGTYYAMQYGFYGLGLALNLELLGVSRNFELQADQLGIQYAWNSGYDPSGFVRFFDKMATEEGYVNGISWFYDHPPFYERMVDAEKEIMFLPKKDHLVVNTDAFQQMKKELTKVTGKSEQEAKNRPSLLSPEKGCPALQKLVYEPDKPIETLCSPAKAADHRGKAGGQ